MADGAWRYKLIQNLKIKKKKLIDNFFLLNSIQNTLISNRVDAWVELIFNIWVELSRNRNNSKWIDTIWIELSRNKLN